MDNLEQNQHNLRGPRPAPFQAGSSRPMSMASVSTYQTSMLDTEPLQAQTVTLSTASVHVIPPRHPMTNTSSATTPIEPPPIETDELLVEQMQRTTLEETETSSTVEQTTYYEQNNIANPTEQYHTTLSPSSSIGRSFGPRPPPFQKRPSRLTLPPSFVPNSIPLFDSDSDDESSLSSSQYWQQTDQQGQSTNQSTVDTPLDDDDDDDDIAGLLSVISSARSGQLVLEQQASETASEDHATTMNEQEELPPPPPPKDETPPPAPPPVLPAHGPTAVPMGTTQPMNTSTHIQAPMENAASAATTSLDKNRITQQPGQAPSAQSEHVQYAGSKPQSHINYWQSPSTMPPSTQSSAPADAPQQTAPSSVASSLTGTSQQPSLTPPRKPATQGSSPSPLHSAQSAAGVAMGNTSLPASSPPTGPHPSNPTSMQPPMQPAHSAAHSNPAISTPPTTSSPHAGASSSTMTTRRPVLSAAEAAALRATVIRPLPIEELERMYGEATRSNDVQAQLRFVRFAQCTAESMPVSGTPTNDPRKRLLDDTFSIVDRLCKANNAEAIYIKGTWAEEGKMSMVRDPERALKYYQRAAKLGCAKANYKIGRRYEHDPNRAMQFYQRAAAMGDASANYRLGRIYLRGELKQRPNPSQALSYLKRAATAPEPSCEAALLLAELRADRHAEIRLDPIERDDHEALQMYHIAAELGSLTAQRELGRIYEEGQLGCSRDPAMSVSWFQRAADGGDAVSALAMSAWCIKGVPGKFDRDDRAAFEWCRKAVEQNLADAEYAFGYYHEAGIGVQVDREVAMAWFRKAAAGGSKLARERLQQLEQGTAMSQVGYPPTNVPTMQAYPPVQGGPPGGHVYPPQTQPQMQPQYAHSQYLQQQQQKQPAHSTVPPSVHTVQSQQIPPNAVYPPMQSAGHVAAHGRPNQVYPPLQHTASSFFQPNAAPQQALGTQPSQVYPPQTSYAYPPQQQRPPTVYVYPQQGALYTQPPTPSAYSR